MKQKLQKLLQAMKQQRLIQQKNLSQKTEVNQLKLRKFFKRIAKNQHLQGKFFYKRINGKLVYKNQRRINERSQCIEKIGIRKGIENWFQNQQEEKNQQLFHQEKEYKYGLQVKENEISDLKKKIEDLSNEFARMLRETLDKMQERIELSQWDSEGDPHMMKKLKELSNIN